jgi:hypothetical protein
MPVSLPIEHPAVDRTLFENSSLRERVIEHLFVGDLLRTLWRQGRRDVEVLHAEVDLAGYDIVVECGGTMRHVQFKSSYRGAKTASVKVHVNLAAKACGCVVWVMFDPATLELGPFRWLGGAPGERMAPLGDRVARHTKADSRGRKAERPSHRVVRRSAFRELAAMEDVAAALFGRPLKSSAAHSPKG